MKSQYVISRTVLILAMSLLLTIFPITPLTRAAGPRYIALDGDDSNSEASHAAPAAGEFTPVNAGLPARTDTSGAWGDYDNDGDLDILLTGYVDEPWSGGDKVNVFRNDGNDAFADTGVLADFSDPSVAWGDYNSDGWLDILLSYSYADGHSARIYHNNRNGAFSVRDVGLQHQGEAAWGDYDNTAS